MMVDDVYSPSLDWAPILTGEMLLFGLMGRLLHTQPDRDWLQSLVQDDVFAESPFADEHPRVNTGLRLLENWSHACRGEISDHVFDSLQADYNDLFVGPGPVLAPPWESVYFNEARMIFQKETLDVRQWYRQFGLEAAKIYKEPDDHIGLELAFLAHLASLGATALEHQDESQISRLLEAQRDFLVAHPVRWVSIWRELVEEHARTDFYRGVALVTDGALTEMGAILGIDLVER